jgi:hypothetical protein
VEWDIKSLNKGSVEETLKPIINPTGRDYHATSVKRAN